MKNILSSRFQKDKVVAIINNHPERYEEVLRLALDDIPQISWRAAWVLYHASCYQDARLLPYLSQIIHKLTLFSNSQQREFLRIIEKFDICDELEGFLFDQCLSIWENPGKSSGTRYFAFKNISRLLKKYPELTAEAQFLFQEQYLEGLSPGIKRSVQKMMAGFNL